MTYQPSVYREQGGNAFVVDVARGGVFKGRLTSTADAAQASAITNVASTAAGTSGIVAGVNSVLAALRGVGILATT